MVDLEAAAGSARLIERAAYGMVYEAEGDEAVKTARDLLRLAVGLRRMLERLIDTARDAGREAPLAHKEE